MRELMKYIEANVDKFVENLRFLCQQPSISAQNVGIAECVETLETLMRDRGIAVKVVPVENGNPVVIGELNAKNTTESLGFYNHYDVQPPEPLELWKSPPFKAEVREGKIFARGVADNKGNIMARLEAVKAVMEVLGEVSMNLKFFFEGEEEIGSPHLSSFVQENMDLLKADGYIWEGGGVDEKGRPVVTLGVKGILYVELRAKGAKSDLHSMKAPLVPNPAWRLVWALTSIKGSDETIRIPGWYDEVIPPSPEEMRLLNEAPFDEEEEKRTLGLNAFLRNVSGLESRKTLLYAPTCNICGFNAGYIGPGQKTLLPSKAMVKVDFRLVEAQKPSILLKRLEEYLDREGFRDIEIIHHSSYEPSKTSPTDPFALRIVKTIQKVYDQKPVIWPNIAGSSPIYVIKNNMGIPVVSGGGVGYPGANIHAPNENIRIKDYIQSIKYIATLISTYSIKR